MFRRSGPHDSHSPSLRGLAALSDICRTFFLTNPTLVGKIANYGEKAASSSLRR